MVKINTCGLPRQAETGMSRNVLQPLPTIPDSDVHRKVFSILANTKLKGHMNQDTIKLLDVVAQKTGYKVSVGQTKDSTSYARMVAASQANPMHIVDINEKYHKLGDYIVAAQCAMLLVKWANPEKIPSFVVRDDKMNYLIDKCSNHSALSKLPAESSKQFARMISQGLMNQLQSQPMEMMAIAFCRQNCPELIELQNETVNTSIREATASLAPNIKAMTPPDIFEKNAVMNAAFAINWARLTGSDIAVLPFKSMGFYDKGYDLFKIFESIPDEDTDRYVKNVDGWAQMLQLSSLYEWHYRKAG